MSLDDIFDLGCYDKSGAEIFGTNVSLAEITDKRSGRLEITLNHPRRNKEFREASKLHQHLIYEKIFDAILAEFHDITTDSKYVFETCKDGYEHLHGYITVELSNKHSVKGLVIQATKAGIFQMPKIAHKQLTQSYYSDQYEVWRTPAVCCQWTELRTRIIEWENYIEKTHRV